MHHLFFLGLSRVVRFGAHPEFAEVTALDKYVCLTAYSATTVSLLCKAVSSCKSFAPNAAALFDLDRALKGCSCGYC